MQRATDQHVLSKVPVLTDDAKELMLHGKNLAWYSVLLITKMNN